MTHVLEDEKKMKYFLHLKRGHKEDHQQHISTGENKLEQLGERESFALLFLVLFDVVSNGIFNKYL